jgi:hypothetical protein
MVWAAGCNVLLGFDEGALGTTTTTTESGTGSGTGPGGGTTASGTSSGTGGAAGGSGPTGGSGGSTTPCTLWGAAVCDDGQKCSVIDDATGDAACVSAGPRPAWSYCESDDQCADRTFCDRHNQVCKPLCQGTGECPANAQCSGADDGDGGIILGMMLCTSHCDPLVPNACDQSFGPTSCLLTASGEFDCYAAGTVEAFDDCDEMTDCAPGLGCHGVGFFLCRPWCVTSTTCPAPTGCLSRNPPVFYDDTEYGMCG